MAFLAVNGLAAPADLQGLARVAGRAAANAVVWIDAPGAPRAAQGKVVLDQRGMTFSPQVLAVQVGTTVVFPNNDRVFHNVFSFHHGTVFDLGLYPVGSSKTVRFDKPGVSRIFCNIHPNMAAYIYVVDSPYFAVTDEAGGFSLTPPAAPRYTYRAWRPGAEELSGVWAPGTASDGKPLLVEWQK
jgi:plastocyanin